MTLSANFHLDTDEQNPDKDQESAAIHSFKQHSGGRLALSYIDQSVAVGQIPIILQGDQPDWYYLSHIC